MKRIVKIISLLMVALSVMAVLTGCNWLDQKRAEHAVWTENGSQESITFGGKIYKKTSVNSRNLNMGGDVKAIRLTDNDVPVLLSDTLGDYSEVSADGKFIVASNTLSGRNVYCLEEYCEAFEELAKNAKLNKMCARRYGDYFAVSDEFLTAVETAVLFEDEYIISTLRYRYELYYCDSSLLFVDHNSNYNVEYDKNGDWYLSIYDSNENKQLYYKVDAKYNGLFSSIYKATTEKEKLEQEVAYTEIVY